MKVKNDHRSMCYQCIIDIGKVWRNNNFNAEIKVDTTQSQNICKSY